MKNLKLFIKKQESSWLDRFIPKQSVLSKLKNLFDKKIFPKIQNDKTIYYSFLFRKNLFQKLDLLHFSRKTYVMYKLIIASIFVIFASLLSIFFLINVADMSTNILFIFFMFILSFFIMDIFIYDKLVNREFEIKSSIPNFLDLLYLTLSTGGFASFFEALDHIGKNMDGVLSKDILYISKMSHFLDIDESLDLLVKRIQDPLIEDLAISVRMTYEFGGDLAKKVLILANESRRLRLLAAKEQANKAIGVLLIPGLIFHLPVIFIIILAPLFINMSISF